MNKIVTFCFIALFSIAGMAQYTEENSKESDKEKEKDEKALEDKRPEWIDNITVGGDFGLYFTGYSGYIGVGPKVGYQVTKWFNPGVTFRYSYNYARFLNGEVLRNHTYGTGAFLHFRLFDKLFAGIEYEILNVSKWSNFEERTWSNVLFLGLGYSQSMGDIGFINFMLQYDVINDINSPFRTSYFIGNPTTGTVIPLRYQIGFTFRLGGFKPN